MSERMKVEGSMVALVTPFADGAVDYDALGRLIEFQIANGTQGLVPCGTTGESPTLSHAEHDKVIEFTVEKAGGRVPVIAGTGSNSTSEALRLTRHAKEAGADACLVVNPYYNKPTQQGMYEHVAALAGAELPIVLYNIPGRTGIEMSPATVARLYNDIEYVVAIKEATGKLDMASEIAASCDITILSGDDSLTLPICAVGGSGVISVLANILPAEVRTLCDAITDFDMAAACTQHLKLFPLCKAMFVETNPIPIKASLAMAGMIRNELRLPLTPLSQKCRPELARLLKEFGVEIQE
ncbi:MAG: 4-hydroxy-tetrahydrodipicolinate synthase [Planctomycetes bacterium ADurb.Bin126]|nr:MAG: 4-hydroxy-tetrahydrodipicolinate synthase [Planctomycetes bacterium ADurb.Bin126]HOD84260.1 4-hydroxy-tetrahydrodipicolinate synthase [Phycisphaerae bacterium]HQL75145.1 4-hydroxy-tetrahydrodipicolinate synthase [Phycisphaerae bacterium]